MAKNMGLILFGGRTEYPVIQEHPGDNGPGLSDQVSVIYITVASQALEPILALFEQWFERREDVIIVDYGTSDKQEVSFLVMEFWECEPDQLFQDILDTENLVGDYTIYTREVD
jgi:hypothetical protein